METVLFPIYVVALAGYFAKSIYLYLSRDFLNIGKDIVVATTAICWYVGIVVFNSDYAFTVTNVIIHGVPYFALIYVYAQTRRETTGPVSGLSRPTGLSFWRRCGRLHMSRELLWHRGVWHERQWLFGSDWNWENIYVYIVPLLALPQLTHYVLDGFIWRRKNNLIFTLFEKGHKKGGHRGRHFERNK